MRSKYRYAYLAKNQTQRTEISTNCRSKYNHVDIKCCKSDNERVLVAFVTNNQHFHLNNLFFIPLK